MAMRRVHHILHRQRALVLLLVSLFLLTSLPVAPVRAQGIDCAKVMPLIPNQFPAWDDGISGWDKAPYYSTILLADIDGDGRAELLARGPGGILVNYFDTATGVWIAKNPGPPFSDQEGYNRAPYYSTLQAANIDDRPGAELIIKASTGIEVWTYHKDTDSWQKLASHYPFADPDPVTNPNPSTDWTKPQYYTTIRLADIDGDGRAELLGRGVDGIQVYGWNTGNNTWEPRKPGPPLADGVWDQPQYYATIQFADIDGQPGAELIARGQDGIVTYFYDKNTDSWTLNDKGPPWTDDNHWNLPQFYSTIQLANIDDKAGAELLGRSDAGMLTYQWNTQTKKWEQLGGVGPFGLGWDDPQNFRTIQLADIDGDRRAELLGRAWDGLYVFRWNGSSWTRVTTLSSMSDANGWMLPQSYLTIQAADIDGQAGAEIIGKAFDGIETWKYANGTFASTLVPGFPPFTTGTKLAAYKAISRKISNEDLVGETDDIRLQYTNTLNKDGWVLARRDAHDLVGTTPPSGIQQADWDAVASQLADELRYVSDTYSWFRNLNDLFLAIAADEDAGGGTVGLVNGYLSLDPNDNATLNWFSLALKFVQGLIGAFNPEEKLFKLAGQVAGLVSTAFSSAVAAHGTSNIQTKVVQLQQKIVTLRQQTQQSTACMETAFLQNWGLLKALAQPIASLEIQWPPTQTAALAHATAKGYELEIWQTLTPLRWNVSCGSGEYCDCGLVTYPADYPDLPTGGEPLLYAIPQIQVVVYIYIEHCNDAPPQLALDHLLHTTPTADDIPLGVPLEDFYCGLNGWRIPRPQDLTKQLCTSGFDEAAVQRAAQQQQRAARLQLQSLLRTVSRQVEDKATRNRLVEPLEQALGFLPQGPRGEEMALPELAELTLHGFILLAKAHAGQEVPRVLAQEYIARAHQVRGLLIETPLSEVAPAKPKKNR